MKIHQVSVDDALVSLHSRPEGLTSAEAEHRLHDFGPNRVERVRGEPLWLQFLGEFTHFFAVILWVAAALAFCADWSEPGQGMGALGWAIVGVIVINSVFSFVQVYRAEKALAALEKLLPHQVRVLRDGVFEKRPAAELVPGDVIALEAGDMVPADCRLIEAFARAGQQRHGHRRVGSAGARGGPLLHARMRCTAPMSSWRARPSSRAMPARSSSPRACRPSSARSPI